MRLVFPWVVCLVVGLFGLVGCENTGGDAAEDGMSGEVSVDGSSTVAPISTVAAEMFNKEHPRVHVTVGVSGTGGGFKKFLDSQPDLRTDINDASRVIKPVEIEKAKNLGIEFVELPVAKDGIAVVVNPKNDFVEYLTVEELKRIWGPESTIANWSEVRDGFPDVPIKLYGPGADSGTFDYFTEAINGKEKVSRTGYTMSEDDNVLVLGVEGDEGALGYFGYAYYEANKDRLKLVAVGADEESAIKPTPETIRAGQYRPLSRPLFLYVNKASLERPAVSAFLDFYLNNALAIVEHPNVSYVALSDEVYDIVKQRLDDRVTGSVMADREHTGPVDVAALYGSATQPAAAN